jgi:hypothetical protein
MKSYPAPNFLSRTALAALIVAQCGLPSFANGHVAPRFSAGPAQLASLNNLPVFGDFDGDQRLDQADLHLAGAHRCIRVRFGDSRESHLEFHATPEVLGTLLTRDINHDNKPDLTWIYHSQSEPILVWLGDGLGHFLKAAAESVDDGLRALLVGDSDPGIVGGVKDEQVYLTPVPVSSELARPANLENESRTALLIAGRNERRDLGLYLSHLRERGPPLDTPFA